MTDICAAAHPAEDGEARPTCRPMRDAHTPACTSDDCRGCEPRTAAHPYRVCTACRLGVHDRLTGRPGRPALPSLATIHADLDQPTRAGATARGATTYGIAAAPAPSRTEQPLDDDQAPPDRRRETRDAIRGVLVDWTHTIHQHHQVVPAGAWTVHALAHHLNHWTDRLLLDAVHAAQLVHDIVTLHRDGLRYAYPAPGRGTLLGRCPDCLTEVRSETTATARCPGCGATRTVDAWHALMVGDLAAEATATKGQLAAWLSARHARAITQNTITQWAKARPGGRPALITVTGQDSQGRNLYPVAIAAQIAERFYGQAHRNVAS